jgi:UDP-3-O-[3-hydroxymyristoyl] glucosamine N-acyltransferase
MNRISAWAVIETEAIGAAVTIAEFAVVRPDVTIGNRVVIVVGAGAVVDEGRARRCARDGRSGGDPTTAQRG